jgi:hypothetical protein
MSDNGRIEQRLAVVEEELARLRQKIDDRPKGNWIERLTGSFKDDPNFEEIVKLGADIRKSQRPDTHG